MVTNIVILIYLALMAYWWGVQGLYYAVLHLICVILAGTLALAVWEPLAISWLLPRMPWYAWGVGLLAPFALILLLLRVTIDRVFKRNPQCGQLTNVIAGGAVGLLAGILTAGLTLIGLGFLPLAADIGGYQPYIVTADGRVAENPDGRLWLLPVDQIASDFFERVSGGSFAPLMSDKSLATHQPDLAVQAALFRLHRDNYDRHASPAATPQGVSAQRFISVPFPNDTLDVGTGTLIERQAENTLEKGETDRQLKLIVVNTSWTRRDDVGTYDKNTLRVFPTQIRLLAHRDDRGRVDARLFPPVGVNWENPQAKRREFLAFEDSRGFPWSVAETAALRWVFVIPDDYEPEALLARHLRLALTPDTETPTEELATLVGLPGASGSLAAETPAEPGVGTVGDRTGPRTGSQAVAIEVSDQLPSAFNATRARGLEYNDGELVSGDATVTTVIGRQDRSCARVFTERHLASVQLTLTRQQAQTLLGEARDRAAALSGVWLVDNRGQQWYPSGYVLVKPLSQMEVKFNRDMPIRSGGELPTTRMGTNDKLYLYFFVERDIRILKYQVGSSVTDVSLVVPPAER